MSAVRIVGVVAAASALFAGTVAAPAYGEVTASVSPESFEWPTRPSVQYRIDMKTGADARTYEFAIDAPIWVDGNAISGAPVVFHRPDVTSPGALSLFSGVIPKFTGKWGTCRRGQELYSDRIHMSVELPANSSSTLTIQADMTGPPWADYDYGVQIDADEYGPGLSNFKPIYSLLNTIGFPVEGQTGVRLDLNVRRRNGETRLWGHTYPSLRHKRVHLYLVRTGVGQYISLDSIHAPGTKDLGTVKTNSEGTFKRTISPAYPSGRIIGVIRKPGRGLLPDWNCSRGALAGR